jgi:hypothetical protein
MSNTNNVSVVVPVLYEVSYPAKVTTNSRDCLTRMSNTNIVSVVVLGMAKVKEDF